MTQLSKTAMARNEDSVEHYQQRGGIVFNAWRIEYRDLREPDTDQFENICFQVKGVSMKV